MSDTSPRTHDPAAGAIAVGYQLAWRHRWLLLGAVALPLVPALLIGTVVDLIWTGGATTIVNGSLVTASHAGAAEWAALIALVLGWASR